jgi:hypothetical protein
MSTEIIPAMPFFAHSDNGASLRCDPLFVRSYLKNACGHFIKKSQNKLGKGKAENYGGSGYLWLVPSKKQQSEAFSTILLNIMTVKKGKIPWLKGKLFPLLQNLLSTNVQ